MRPPPWQGQWLLDMASEDFDYFLNFISEQRDRFSVSHPGALIIPDRDFHNASSTFSQPPDRETLEASFKKLEHTDDVVHSFDFAERMRRMILSTSVGYTTHSRQNQLTTMISRQTTLRSIPRH